MGDKKAFLFPSLLFVFFFFLVTITGFIQIGVIEKNIGEWHRREAELVYDHIRREIETGLEYLSLAETSPPVITPIFLDVLAYDEAIVDDIYDLMKKTSRHDCASLPFENLLVVDLDGATLLKRGSIGVPTRNLEALISGRESTLVQLPSHRDKALLMGMRFDNGVVFLSLGNKEMDMLRKRYIIGDILEREGKRLNVIGVNLYDEKGALSASSEGLEKQGYIMKKPLNSLLLPGHTMEIVLSRDIGRDILKRTKTSFLFIIAFLIMSGAIGTYLVFFLERRHNRRVKAIEREMALKERLVSLGSLASGMAHEIKNPLNAMSMSVQRLKREFSPPDEQKMEYEQFIDIIRNELTRVNGIVEEFLLSTKSQAPFIQEDLFAIIEEVVAALQEKARLKGVTLVIIPVRNLEVECQKERLKQAFYNIIINAIEAMEGTGEATIHAKPVGDTVEVSIDDSGPGIDADERSRILEYHYTTKDRGMGLGLPISYMIVKDHGGDLTFHSEPGKGSSFRITLPVRHGG